MFLLFTREKNRRIITYASMCVLFWMCNMKLRSNIDSNQMKLFVEITWLSRPFTNGENIQLLLPRCTECGAV